MKKFSDDIKRRLNIDSITPEGLDTFKPYARELLGTYLSTNLRVVQAKSTYHIQVTSTYNIIFIFSQITFFLEFFFFFFLEFFGLTDEDMNKPYHKSSQSRRKFKLRLYFQYEFRRAFRDDVNFSRCECIYIQAITFEAIYFHYKSASKVSNNNIQQLYLKKGVNYT